MPSTGGTGKAGKAEKGRTRKVEQRERKWEEDDSASNSLESYPITEQIANVFAGSSSVLLLKCIRDRVCRAYLVTIRNIINVPIIFRKHCGAIRDLISET